MWKFNQVTIGVFELMRQLRQATYERQQAACRPPVIDFDFRLAAKNE